MINIVIAGPRGNMGKEAVRMVEKEENFQLKAVVDRKYQGFLMKDVDGMEPLNVPVYENMEICFQEVTCDVLIDLTSPEVGKKHMLIAFNHGVRPVVGTTGFTDQDIEELSKIAEEKKLGAIIAPNFAIGAILLMKFSQMAAKYMKDVEIIEQHHDRKLDAPSGTAVKTAQMISEVREPKTQGHPEESEQLKGARGADYQGMRIHSVRLPGLVAHQEVLFGGEGQSLKLRHDSFNRTSFMPGVKLACETVMKLNVLVYGLDQVIE
ncbi:4-hydroxy-tetrahydrodipicolinate reductase [Salipaludibacillus keqinensis]|jgi:4-hydroxy-tetrahydrodipicolinate reductase|uniref:4-hydroxy-tetrahydrodipicolinate reductase n=1 Tax=Salipaludibacillus keqinensis TaxID=2045207 RepID=A0A323TYB6_9BACI|nr:4-hydroxy-tetrahydrodipicolinate reductase [Salipaludibacillus keqinensis]PYZ94535.1 4-hydroxy-tetrahydrodipicolinate reductase [Salipaludibacillus keqinensis]